MLVKKKQYRTIWESSPVTVKVIDQTQLPFIFEVKELATSNDVYSAIKDMIVRGAPLIGVTAAYGIYFAALEAPLTLEFEKYIAYIARKLKSARPTAVNLAKCINDQIRAIHFANTFSEKTHAALENARMMADDDVKTNKKIGKFGAELLNEISAGKGGEPVNILTHCNAGWLATVDHGTALAPVYEAFAKGVKLHVWVDETRPRNQGAKLTAWELQNYGSGIPHTIITDNAGGHLMQHGKVDIVLVGTDRTTLNGDVANKIGTYLKALAAMDNNIPFYAAVPSSSIDFDIEDGIKNIPIEERNTEEISEIEGFYEKKLIKFKITPKGSPISNYGFDVTPARLVTGLITERGICKPDKVDISALFYDKL